MYTDKITQSVAEAVKQVLATEKLHPNQQKLDVHEPEKDELTSNDFKMLRKGKKADVKEANNPFDVKNYKSQLPTKPGELAGFDSKKISTGTVYTRKPVKDEQPMKEEATGDEFKNELKKAQDKSMGKEKADVAKASTQAVRQEEVDINAINGVKMSTIDEKHMTEPEMKKREEIVKSMKKGLAGFKERYGDRAKNVMYATATKQAMKD